MQDAVAALANATIETTAWGYVAQYGVVAIIAIVFGYVIRALYNRSQAKDEAIAKERAEWAVKEVTLRADYEAKHVAALVEYNKQLHELREASQIREDLIRKEFSDLMENVAEEATKTSNATIDVLHKFYDRILGPKAR